MKLANMIGSLFGKNDKYQLNQLRRAATIENIIQAGVADRQTELIECKSTNNEPTELQLLICGAAVRHNLAHDISELIEKIESLGGSSKLIYAKAQEILDSDADLEKLIIRVLYDIASLGMLLNSIEWARNLLLFHPRIQEVLRSNRSKHPDMFEDATEEKFKHLFDEFYDKYNISQWGGPNRIFSP